MLDEAEQHCRLAVELSPGPDSYDTWAWVALLQNRYGEATVWFTEA